MEDKNKNSHGVQSLEVGLSVLNVLVDAAMPLMLKEVAQQAHMPPAKAHRYLVSLMRYDYAKQTEKGLYVLGDKALSLGLAATRRTDALQLLQPQLQSLQNSVSGYLQVTRWTALGPLVVQFWDDEFGVPIGAKVGALMPLFRSATGRVFATYLDISQWQQLAEQEGFCSLAEFEQYKKIILASGISAVEGEMMAGINAMAAPVFDANGDLLYVVTCLGRPQQIDVQLDSEPMQQLKKSAQAMSRYLLGSQ